MVLVHGTFANASSWSSLSPDLAADGYCVFALNYGCQALGPVICATGPVEESARQLSAFIDTPYQSIFLSGAGVNNILIQASCPLDFTGHLGIVADRNAIGWVEQALDSAAQNPDCTLFLSTA